MVQGTGISIVEIARIERVRVERPRWLRHWFCSEELDRSGRRARPQEELAGRFACKTAVRAALLPQLATGAWLPLNQIVTYNDALGKPLVRLSDNAASLFGRKIEASDIHVSITHARDYAAAVAIFDGEPFT